jgi:hypothetical protein
MGGGSSVSAATSKWADQQLASLRERYPEWDFWYVPSFMGSFDAWCAKPSGAMIATCRGHTPDGIAGEVDRFQIGIAGRIREARAELESPRSGDGRKKVLQQQLTAMTRLQGILAATR